MRILFFNWCIATFKPGRDVRDELPKPVLKSELLDISNLKAGMVLTGTVRNVTDFGAFVDISVHQDGLVHISEISKDYVKHPSDNKLENIIVEFGYFDKKVGLKNTNFIIYELRTDY